MPFSTPRQEQEREHRASKRTHPESIWRDVVLLGVAALVISYAASVRDLVPGTSGFKNASHPVPVKTDALRTDEPVAPPKSSDSTSVLSGEPTVSSSSAAG